MQSLLNELKRRNVFRATTSYTIVAWVLIQAASVVLPAFEAPDWILKVLLLFMAAGFPMVVLLAWVYELTPEGIQRTPEADDGRQPGSSRAFDSVLIVGLILALIITTTGKYLPNAFSSASAAVVQTVGKSATPEDPVRMAVMPFVTVNTSPEVSALAAGFSESIRGFLEDHTKLVVAGAASSLKAAMDHKTRVQIGQELDVQYLLEGTLRINNNQVHVFVQLVNVPDGKAVWSRDVERGRDQLESIEASIVTGVSDRFDMSVTGRQQSMLAPAMFADWEQVLGLLRGGDQKSLERARTLAKSITQHVPKFGPAHAALAFILCADRSKGNTAEFDDRANTVGGLLDDAMAEAPRDRRVLLWRARSQSLIERWRGRDDDFQRINAQFEDALSIFPGDSDLLTAYAEHRYAWGDTHRAIALANRALKNDPMSPAARKVRIASLIRSGQYDMASAAIAKLESGDLKLRLEGKLAVAQGHLHKALDAYDKMTGAGAKAPLEAARV
ncbi:MAG TPA: hypothetical protein VJ998_11985, partial [Pseudomonadales bacterium]|nr:hypothetical protein [Pseudomonadales bacterium]